MKKKRDIRKAVTLMVYRRQEPQPFRWLVAAIIFVLGMCVTFSEVSGAEGTQKSVVIETSIARQLVTPSPIVITSGHQLK